MEAFSGRQRVVEREKGAEQMVGKGEVGESPHTAEMMQGVQQRSFVYHPHQEATRLQALQVNVWAYRVQQGQQNCTRQDMGMTLPNSQPAIKLHIAGRAYQAYTGRATDASTARMLEFVTPCSTEWQTSADSGKMQRV